MVKRKQKVTSNEAAIQSETLLAHVRELQIRLLVTAVVLVGAGVVAYLYYAEILDILRKPLNAPLYTSSVSGDFSFVMKICMVAGIAVSVPLIIYNFIMFVRPAFIEVFTLKRVVLMTAGSIIAAAGGALFGYFFIIPGAIHFFSGFQVSGLKAMIQADGYLNFVVNVIVTFILMFQLPIIASLIDRIKPISPRAMWKGEKWALIGSILISLVVPFAMDFMTQLLIAAPIFILYNISFVVIAAQHAYGKKVEKKVTRKNDRLTARQTKLVAAKQAKAPKAPVRPVHALAAAPAVIAPNAQLEEVFALQSKLHTPAAHHASVHPTLQHAVKPAVSPIFVPKTQPSVKPVTVHASRSASARPAAVTVSMDMVAATPSRSRPTQIIRSAGPVLTPPQRPASPYRSMRFMSDIR